MKVIAALICLALGLALTANASDLWPRTPHPGLTPGSLCRTPSEYRYPERIPYCTRAVKSEVKDRVVQIYDSTLGTRIAQRGRRNFKIDHLIPLCMGGSNEVDNLWPQHPEIYTLTDPVEGMLCSMLQEGKIRQAEAIRLILLAKTRHDQIPVILDRFREL
jgi:hypothetical protein